MIPPKATGKQLLIAAAMAATFIIACSPHSSTAPTSKASSMNIDPIDSEIAWGKSQNGLRAGLRLSSTGNLTLTLENTSKDTLQVRSHVSTHERQYDWFRIFAQAEGAVERHEFLLLDERNRSAPVTVTLAAGARLSHDIDFVDWSHRHDAGLSAGKCKVWFTYSVDDVDVWRGNLTSGSLAATADAEGRLLRL
jgi:hypothetical protein